MLEFDTVVVKVNCLVL